jgi:hypothetical protein
MKNVKADQENESKSQPLGDKDKKIFECGILNFECVVLLTPHSLYKWHIRMDLV